jgi:hypothetical protein
MGGGEIAASFFARFYKSKNLCMTRPNIRELETG